jgi:hypothetical protein
MDPITLGILLASGGLVALSLRDPNRLEEEVDPEWDDFLRSHLPTASDQQKVAFDAMQEAGLPPPVYSSEELAREFVNSLSTEEFMSLAEEDREIRDRVESHFRDYLPYVDMYDLMFDIRDKIDERMESIQPVVVYIRFSDYVDRGVDAEVYLDDVPVGITLRVDPGQEPLRLDTWGTYQDNWSSRPLPESLEEPIVQAVREAFYRSDMEIEDLLL